MCWTFLTWQILQNRVSHQNIAHSDLKLKVPNIFLFSAVHINVVTFLIQLINFPNDIPILFRRFIYLKVNIS